MKKIIALLAVFVPALAGAQVITDVNSLTYKLTNIANTFIQILIAVAVLYIIWHVVRFLIIGGTDEEARKTARTAILWGVIGLFIILSIWGLVRILTNTFRTDTSAPVSQYPTIQYPTTIP